jgi:prepilin-type N-terminal cleavage/methylation domain-containing protein
MNVIEFKNRRRNYMTNKSGFTLLEILVVIIIVGVLASVAMPSLFRNVERSRAVEAFFSIGVIKRQMDGCATQFNGNYTTCATFNQIGMSDPSNSVNPLSHFNYAIAGAGAGAYTITATRVALDNGNSGDTINMILAAGVITRNGNGAFAGLQ